MMTETLKAEILIDVRVLGLTFAPIGFQFQPYKN